MPRAPPVPPVPVLPVLPVVVVAPVSPPPPVETLLLPPLPVPIIATPHWPSLHTCPFGQTTPAHGQLPHAPVTGSQHEPLVQGLGAHLLAPHVGGAPEVSQTCPAAHAGTQVGMHFPSLHTWSPEHVTPEHEATQSKPVNVAFGLHS